MVAAPQKISPTARYRCGKRKLSAGKHLRKTLEEIDDASRLAETAQVALQPHRHGSRSDMAESELGRFILLEMARDDENDRRHVYSSCLDYFNIVCCWRRHKGVPMPHRIETYRITEFLTENELFRKVAWLRQKIDECNAAMAAGSTIRLLASRNLILDDAPVLPELRQIVKAALLGLTKEF